MSQTELIVPEPTAEESTVINRFIQASRDIVPTVQISLAKRIIHPGSNRVVCLAAHTSVPLHPDEAASVSDLALRLSDGTNVRLSLSFFNDGTFTPEFPLPQPYQRTIYDPNKYESTHSSRLPAAFLTLLLAVGAGAWFAPNSPLRQMMPMPPVVKASSPSAKPVATVSPASVPTIAPQSAQPAAEPTEVKTASAPVHKKGRKQKLSAGHASSHSAPSGAAKEMGLVPPPPPTPWTFAPGGQFQSIDPEQLNAQLGRAGKSPTKAVTVPGGVTDGERLSSHGAPLVHSPKKASAPQSPAPVADLKDDSPASIVVPTGSGQLGGSLKPDVIGAPPQSGPSQPSLETTGQKMPETLPSQPHPTLDISNFPGYGMARTK
jgi:hypothetical protein